MISASDIRERKFEKAAFGYKQEEIDDFLAELISEFEELDAEREDLHSKIQIIAQAEEKTKILLDEATVQHEAAMEKNRAEIAKEKENLIEAQKQVSEFKKSLFDMYKTHLEMISAMPEIELDEEDTSQYSEQTETTEEELPQPDPFATSSFSARTIKGVYESRFTDLQFGQNNSHTGNTTTTEKEEV